MTACPIPFETHVGLWAGELAPEAAKTVEQHLFSCDPCAEVSDRLGTLVTGLRQLIPPVISPAHRDRLLAAGTRLRHTPVDANVATDATFGPDVDLLVHVLRADLSRAERVDVEVLDEQGVPRLQFPLVPFDVQAGEVLLVCQRHYQSMFADDPTFAVHVVEGGVRRAVGNYLVRHHWV